MIKESVNGITMTNIKEKKNITRNNIIKQIYSHYDKLSEIGKKIEPGIPFKRRNNKPDHEIIKSDKKRFLKR